MDSWRTTFLPGDTLKERLKKAAHVSPSPAQLKWMEREYVAFLHYSPTPSPTGSGAMAPKPRMISARTGSHRRSGRGCAVRLACRW